MNPSGPEEPVPGWAHQLVGWSEPNVAEEKYVGHYYNDMTDKFINRAGLSCAMKSEEIIEVLNAWNFWKRDYDVGIPREKYLALLERFVKTQQVVGITGVRRSGKSTLLKQFIKRQIDSGRSRNSFLYVNFEEPRFAGHRSPEFLQQIYEAYLEIVGPKEKPYLLLDEVQNIPEWERFVRGLHEKKEAHILVSGSTSALMSKELGTLLTGRWLEVRVSPLDFPEFLLFRQIKIQDKLDLMDKKVLIRRLLREYLEFGGFPLVALQEEKAEILGRYFDDIMGRDITARNRIRSVDKVKALATHYLTSFSSPISYRKIARTIGLSLDSVERFSAYMEEAYLLFFVPKFSYSLREQGANPRKVYGIDLGLINQVSFRFSDNLGRLYENLVFLSLLKDGKNVYYYRDRRECDFVIKEGKRVTQAIQVSYALEANREREIQGLCAAMDELNLREGLIISDSLEEEMKVSGKVIRIVPLWKWLLT